MSWYAEQRNAQLRTGQQRRRNAWIALAVAVSCWLTIWAGRNLLG